MIRRLVVTMTLVIVGSFFEFDASPAKEFHVGKNVSNQNLDQFWHRQTTAEWIDVPSFPGSVRVAVTANDPRAQDAEELIKIIFKQAGVRYVSDVATKSPFVRVIFTEGAIDGGIINFELIPASIFDATIASILDNSARSRLHGYDCAPAAIRYQATGKLIMTLIIIDKDVSDDGVRDCVLHGLGAALGVELQDRDIRRSVDETWRSLRELIETKKKCLKSESTEASCFG